MNGSGSNRRIILTRAPSKHQVTINQEGRCQYPVGVGYGHLIPPITSMYIASFLRSNGYEVKILDCQTKWVPQERFLPEVEAWKPAFVGFQSGMFTLADDLDTAREVKRIHPGVRTVFYDEYPTAVHEVVGRDSSVDFVIRGDPELVFLDIASGKCPDDINGITFHRGSNLIVNPVGARPDLDGLPFPAIDLIDMSLYKHPVFGKPYAFIQVSRGCNFRCTFCTAGLYYGQKVRFRSAKNIVDEIEDRVRRLNVRHFDFYADTLTVNKAYTRELCEEILKRKLDIVFWGNSRVDTVDVETLQMLKEAGCYLLAFGVESGSEKTLELVKKGITLQQAKETVALCRQVGIQSLVFMMIGFPWETTGHMHETYRFADSIDPDWAQFSSYVPFPGTELTAEFVDKGLVVSLDPFDTYRTSMVCTEHVSADGIKRVLSAITLKFYSRPHRLVRILRSRSAISLVLLAASVMKNRFGSRGTNLSKAHTKAIGLPPIK